jgi:hypothetical protein
MTKEQDDLNRAEELLKAFRAERERVRGGPPADYIRRIDESLKELRAQEREEERRREEGGWRFYSWVVASTISGMVVGLLKVAAFLTALLLFWYLIWRLTGATPAPCDIPGTSC